MITVSIEITVAAHSFHFACESTYWILAVGHVFIWYPKACHHHRCSKKEVQQPLNGPEIMVQVLERILAVDYHFPSSIPVSENCKDLLRHILVADPAKRYSIADIQKHPW